LFFLSFGAGYHWDAVSINFAFGQFIPIASHKRSAESTQSSESTPATSGGSSSSGKDILSKIGDYINHNPGGNIARFLVSLYF
jgi:hypothetical protein